jgi:hypothetical protein
LLRRPTNGSQVREVCAGLRQNAYVTIRCGLLKGNCLCAATTSALFIETCVGALMEKYAAAEPALFAAQVSPPLRFCIDARVRLPRQPVQRGTIWRRGRPVAAGFGLVAVRAMCAFFPLATTCSSLPTSCSARHVLSRWRQREAAAFVRSYRGLDRLVPAVAATARVRSRAAGSGLASCSSPSTTSKSSALTWWSPGRCAS